MAIHSFLTLSSSSATRLTPLGIHSGMDITLQNVDDTAYVFIGSSAVTASDYGYRIAPGHAISFELPGKDDLYAITDTNESNLAVLKTNLEHGV
jgi:hypothetical protein